jgi:multiple sugar transport system substrate-binding protein
MAYMKCFFLFRRKEADMRNYRFVLAALVLLLALSVGGMAVAQSAVEIQLMGWSSSPAENTRLQEVIDTFNKNNADIKVKLNQVPDYDTTLQTAIAGKNPPDVFYVDSFKFPDLLKAGALDNGEGKIEKADDFYPSLRAAFTADKNFYCPPKDFSTLALQVNTDMMKAAGIEKAPTTWDELKAAAQKMTTSDQVGIVVPNDFARLIAFVYAAGGSVISEDASKMTINSPESKAAVDFYTGLVAEGYGKKPADLDSGWPGEAFGKGKAAMAFEGNWMIPFLKDNYPDLKYTVVEMPAGPKSKATMAFTVCYGVASAAAGGKNQDAAWKLVNYLTGEEGMKAWTDLGLAMPTRASLKDGWLKTFPNLEPFLAGAEYARGWQFTTGFNDVLKSINDDMLEVFSGSKTSEDLLKNAETIGNEILAKAMAK